MDSFPYRAVLFFFMFTTLLLLFILLVGNRGTNNLREIATAPTTDYVTNSADDIFVDDDDRYQIAGDSSMVAQARSSSAIIGT